MKIVLIGIFLLIFNSCNKDNESEKEATNPISNSINKIMALGASRVEGGRPDFESFRYELWKDLTENNWSFDFIGTQVDDASYPLFNNIRFDKDHEGRGGNTSEEILDIIANSLKQIGPPDIVLFSSPGGNDALQSLPYENALSNTKAIIAALQTANPNITILIEQGAAARSDRMTTELTTFFDKMKQGVLDIAEEDSTESSRIIAIDMFTGFTDALFADEVHYNEAGADFIANKYYEVLEGILEE